MRLGAPASVVEKREDQLQHLVGYIQDAPIIICPTGCTPLLVVPFFEEDRALLRADDRHRQRSRRPARTDGLHALGADPACHAFPAAFVRNLLNHRKLIEEYFSITGQIRTEFEAPDLAALSSDELIGYLHHFAHRFMRV
ncbi:MAG: hypothetical protein R3F47_20220 [Gammaproteobacteria bacterium]